MGLVHRTATVSPSKQEIVEAWLPAQPWAAGLEITEKVGEYRLDDPEGEVGVETILWRVADGSLIQTPLTYRAAPLAGADEFLAGTMDHSVLGKRWVYDGCGDPVWASTLATAMLTGGQQSQMWIEMDGERVDVPPRVVVHGTGSSDAEVPEITSVDAVTYDGDALTVVQAGGLQLDLARRLGVVLEGDERLVGELADLGDGESVDLAALWRGVQV